MDQNIHGIRSHHVQGLGSRHLEKFSLRYASGFGEDQLVS